MSFPLQNINNLFVIILACAIHIIMYHINFPVCSILKRHQSVVSMLNHLHDHYITCTKGQCKLLLNILHWYIIIRPQCANTAHTIPKVIRRQIFFVQYPRGSFTYFLDNSICHLRLYGVMAMGYTIIKHAKNNPVFPRDS